MALKVSDQLLRDMFALCSFSIPDDGLVFFALRGVQPVRFGGSEFKNEHDVVATPIDYLHMRCTIGQWDTGARTLAVFVGSSVPYLTGIQGGIPRGGRGVNRLASGYFGNLPGMPDHRYVKGHHGRRAAARVSQ